MRRLDLSEFNVYEKFGWVIDALGDYDAVDGLLLELSNAGNVLEQTVSEFTEHADGEVPGDDLVAWLVEGWGAFEVLEFVHSEHRVEEEVDSLVQKHELDVCESPDGFDSYNDFCAWRNS